MLAPEPLIDNVIMASAAIAPSLLAPPPPSRPRLQVRLKEHQPWQQSHCTFPYARRSNPLQQPFKRREWKRGLDSCAYGSQFWANSGRSITGERVSFLGSCRDPGLLGPCAPRPMRRRHACKCAAFNMGPAEPNTGPHKPMRRTVVSFIAGAFPSLWLS